MDKEEAVVIEKGSRDSFYIRDSGAIFAVAFDKIFDKELLGIHNEFEMSSKRNFKNLAETILTSFQELFLQEDGKLNPEHAIIFMALLNSKNNVMIRSPMPFNDLLGEIDRICSAGDSAIIRVVSDYIEKNYVDCLDAATELSIARNKKINDELLFSDEMAKTLLKIAYLYRFMTPLISVYYTFNKEVFSDSGNNEVDDEDSEDLAFGTANASVFSHLFSKFTGDSDNLRNKLYKLVYSRISKTAYSDSRFWSAAKLLSISVDTEALGIYRKILTNVIAKLDVSRNIVSFFQSVIKNQIDFLFQNKFKYRAQLIAKTVMSSTENDEDEMTELEKLEIREVRFNEGSFITRETNIADVLKRIPDEFDVGVDDAEVKALLRTLKRNTIQEQIIAMLTFRHFGDSLALKLLDFYQYCYLVVACKKFLEKHKFLYLPKILTANCEKHKDRQNISGKKVRPEILASKKYKDFIDAKFPFFSEEVEKPLLAFIGTTYSSIFTDEQGHEIFDSSVKVGKIAEELIDAATLV